MKRKTYKSSEPFINNLLKYKEIKILYEEERSKTLIADAVKAARQRAGLTQTQLAELANTTQTVISRMESGEDRMPSLSLLARVAAACEAKLTVGSSFKKAA